MLDADSEFINYASMTNTGTLTNASTLTNDIYGTLENNGTVTNNSTLTNDGTLINDSELVNYGTMDNNDTLISTGTLINNGTFNFTGGTLNVDSFNGDLANTGGTLGPGHSPGTTTINGDYFQDASSTLLIEIEGLIAGTEYDVLNVTGTATLDGVLDFDLDYSGLVLGDSFDILSAEVISGTFASITDQQININWIWELDYNLDPSGTDILTALVTVVPIPEPATLLLAMTAAPLRVRCG